MRLFKRKDTDLTKRIDRLETLMKHNHPDEFTIQRELNRLDSSFQDLQEQAKGVTDAASDTATYLQEELKNTRYRFFTVIDNMVDIVIIKDAECRWLTANKYTQDILGLELSDYYLKTDQEVADVTGMHVTEIDFGQDSNSIAWETKRSVRVTETFVDIHGIRRYFDVIKTPTYKDEERNERKEMIIIGRDITEVKSTQQRNKMCVNALNSASDLVLITDGQTNITFCNDQFIKDFGFDSHDEIEGRPISILKSGFHNNEFYQDIWDTVSNNITWRGTIVNQGKNGNNIECDTTIVPVMNGLVRPIYYIQVMKISKSI